MDIKQIKNKLQEMQTKPRKKMDRSDYEKIFWKPQIGKQVIRVVPSKYDAQNPFKEAYFYYGIGANIMLSPATFGEPDPIKLFVKKLRSTNDKDNWSLARKLEAKLRIFAPVVVRGEEDKGVRWWEFGKNMYLEFLQMAEDEDIGDFTDVNDGRDFTVDTVGPEVTGTKYNKSSLRPKTKITPLSEDPSKVKEWLENQPDPLEIYTKFTFEQMKENLQRWLEPETDDEPESEEEEPVEEEVIIPPKSNFKVKKSKMAEFDKLFGDEEKEGSDDDLPF